MSKKTEGSSEFEKLALLALRAELSADDVGEARLHWKELQKKAEDAGQRRWFLLAAKRDRELTLAPKK